MPGLARGDSIDREIGAEQDLSSKARPSLRQNLVAALPEKENVGEQEQLRLRARCEVAKLDRRGVKGRVILTRGTVEPVEALLRVHLVNQHVTAVAGGDYRLAWPRVTRHDDASATSVEAIAERCPPAGMWHAKGRHGDVRVTDDQPRL